MSLSGILHNISYHKKQLNKNREDLIGLLYLLQNNDYFSNYVASLKNIIYNLNF